MAILKAIGLQLFFHQLLATFLVGRDEFSDREEFFPVDFSTMSVIPMIDDTIYRDEVVNPKFWGFQVFIYPIHGLGFMRLRLSFLLRKILIYHFSLLPILEMANNIQRAFQDIDLGVNDAPFVLPAAVIQQAAEENRFILVGRLVMPRRQNLRAIVSTMPRN